MIARAFLFCGLAFAAPCLAESTVDFDGETYVEAWSAEHSGAQLTEFLRPGEKLETWKRMISVQLHPKASRVADVINPYAAARKSPYAADPQIFRSDSSKHAEDLIFEFLLLAPDKSHFEFVLLRAFSDPQEPVTLYVFSRKTPLDDEARAESELSVIKEKRADWFRGLNRLEISPSE